VGRAVSYAGRRHVAFAVDSLQPSFAPHLPTIPHTSTSAVFFLLSHGADTTVPEKDGYTPMHAAAFQGRAEIVKMLVKHGLDPRPMHRDGFEPIFRACWGRESRFTETVKVFLDAGVPFDVRGGKDEIITLIDAARENKQTVQLLQAFKNREEAMNKAKEVGEGGTNSIKFDL